jgi:putative oxidoreductase
VFHGDPSSQAIVQIFEFEGAPGHGALDSLTLERRCGTTLVRTVTAFSPVEDRDAMAACGMDRGVRDSDDRLAGCLPGCRPIDTAPAAYREGACHDHHQDARGGPPARPGQHHILGGPSRPAAFFVAAAVPKLAGAHSAVVMCGQVGAGQWLRYLVGAAEQAGAGGRLVRRLAGLAAAGLAADMTGATILNIAVLHSGAAAMTLLLCVAFLPIAHVRWEQTRRLAAVIRR